MSIPDILQKIIDVKKREVALKKIAVPQDALKSTPLFSRTPISLSSRLRSNTVGVIAEHKRRSPSKPSINQSLSVFDVARGYEAAGVSGMSVLTDGQFFGGSLDDLLLSRAACNLPLLRKDFTIDPYQIIEAKAHGADVILLIAAALTPAQTRELALVADDLGLEVLLEVHNLKELQEHLNDHCHLVGVNNRNLKTFQVSLTPSLELASAIPDHLVKISESGLADAEDVFKLQQAGYGGFLMGEHFMKTGDPGEAARSFIKAVEKYHG